RSCGSLDRRIVVEAELVLDRGDKKEIHALRESARKRRRWMKGLRSAGSVFRNPEHESAGSLLDSAGLKGVGIGGAFVSKEHANVIVTRDGALASDVLALMEKMRVQVQERSGVVLENEIVVWG
ncbi:MAG: UDP-N-acetylenolpyruvoylglucosamine reductase, partial [Kiritimatiellae bacterium]|nr:UDP-N-acetylenolpyruvoylglucosamine reductase [Kiritimatiellia bacterium]